MLVEGFSGLVVPAVAARLDVTTMTLVVAKGACVMLRVILTLAKVRRGVTDGATPKLVWRVDPRHRRPARLSEEAAATSCSCGGDNGCGMEGLRMDGQARAAAAAMWDGADYHRMAQRLRPAADALAAVVADAPEGPVLDLAAGTGSVATAVASAGRAVEAVDIAPGLVATGRSRTSALGLDVTWRVAAMDDLEPGPRFGAVVSSFGIIFAPDPVRTLRRVAGTLLPGGVLALAVWDPVGYVADMSRAMSRTLPEPGRSAARAWIPWGDSATVRNWLEVAGLTDVQLRPQTLPWRFGSVEEAVTFLFEASPGHVAAARFTGDGDRLRAVVTDHLLAFAGLTDPAQPVDIASSYMVVTARRPLPSHATAEGEGGDRGRS